MTLTREELREAYRRLTAFRDLAAKAGRGADAAALDAGAEACGLALEAFGRPGSAYRALEDGADAAEARAALARMMTGAGGVPDGTEECCPYSTGYPFCQDCRVFRGPFTIQGSPRRYVCLTLWSTRR